MRKEKEEEEENEKEEKRKRAEDRYLVKSSGQDPFLEVHRGEYFPHPHLFFPLVCVYSFFPFPNPRLGDLGILMNLKD